MMKQHALSFLLAGLATLSPLAHAQETTASGNLNTQASWTALQNMLSATNGRVDILQTDVGEMKKCAKDGKIWKQGTGCVSASVSQPNDPRIQSIIDCAKNRQFYNGVTCLDAPDTSLRWAYGGQVNLGKTAAYMAPEGGVSKYKNAGISEACTTAQNDARPCTKKGAKCYSITSREDTCGGKYSEHSCQRISSHHFQQCM